jgi:carbonic anhydrase/acetyltransferase-like protein (isoleucine patch superfamily)
LAVALRAGERRAVVDRRAVVERRAVVDRRAVVGRRAVVERREVERRADVLLLRAGVALRAVVLPELRLEEALWTRFSSCFPMSLADWRAFFSWPSSSLKR